MAKIMKIYLLTAIVTLASCLPSFASGPGTTAVNFLKIGPGARAISLGEAFCALCDDATSLYWNPAGLARIESPQISATYNSWLAGSSQGYLSLAYPLSSPNVGCLALGINYMDMGLMTRTSLEGEELGGFDADDTHVTLGYGYPLTHQLNMGVSGGFVNEVIDNEGTVSYFLGSLGFLYEGANNLTLGLAFLNFGEDPLPSTVKVGAATQVESFTFSLDVGFPNDNDSYFGLGAEWRAQENLFLRLGYRGNNDEGQGLVGGAGFIIENLSLDYAFLPCNELGDTHRVSLGVRF